MPGTKFLQEAPEELLPFVPLLLAETDESFAPSEDEGAKLVEQGGLLRLPPTFVTKVVSVSSPEEESQMAGFLSVELDETVQAGEMGVGEGESFGCSGSDCQLHRGK